MKKLVVLISGNGSNLQSILDACTSGRINGSVAAVFSNKASAFGLTRAQQAGIPAHALTATDYPNREAFDRQLMQAIDAYAPDLVVLAGYMRILSSAFVTHYHDRLLNIHPALRAAALWSEVKDQLGQNALTLSSGQQQRLVIARAIAIEPEVLLLDEPTSALDPISTLVIEELMTTLKQHFTLVLVTHNMQQAARVSDYTAFMDSGQLIEFDETDRMFTAPRVRKTEEYITGRFG